MKSRYIPFTQQPYCCVPACIQMVLYKNDLPLKSQEEIGNALGLRVRPESAHLFENVSTQEPKTGIWGTQIGNQRYEINDAFKNLGIPLAVTIQHIKDIKSADELEKMLYEVEQTGGDALVCYKYGVLWNTDSNSGHVSVFDRIIDGKIRLVDPEQQVPKLRLNDAGRLYEAMVEHKAAAVPGVWIFSSK